MMFLQTINWNNRELKLGLGGKSGKRQTDKYMIMNFTLLMHNCLDAFVVQLLKRFLCQYE